MEEEFIPTTTVTIKISREEIQNLAQMKSESDVFEHLRIWYGIDTNRIVSVQIIAEATMAPSLVLKLKQL